jgi:hypothetical protein
LIKGKKGNYNFFSSGFKSIGGFLSISDFAFFIEVAENISAIGFTFINEINQKNTIT